MKINSGLALASLAVVLQIAMTVADTSRRNERDALSRVDSRKIDLARDEAADISRRNEHRRVGESSRQSEANRRDSDNARRIIERQSPDQEATRDIAERQRSDTVQERRRELDSNHHRIREERVDERRVQERRVREDNRVERLDRNEMSRRAAERRVREDMRSVEGRREDRERNEDRTENRRLSMDRYERRNSLREDRRLEKRIRSDTEERRRGEENRFDRREREEARRDTLQRVTLDSKPVEGLTNLTWPVMQGLIVAIFGYQLMKALPEKKNPLAYFGQGFNSKLKVF